MAIIIVVVGTFFYFVNEELREKTEFLPPQERWQIIDMCYNESCRDTVVTLKYVGENTAIDVWVRTSSFSSSSIASSYFQYFDTIDLGNFHKGETFTFNIYGWTDSFTLNWRMWRNSTLTTAKFDELLGEY